MQNMLEGLLPVVKSASENGLLRNSKHMVDESPPHKSPTRTRGAIVLCGGQSIRMGQDKANLPFGPETMLQRVVRKLGEVIDPCRIVVVAAVGQKLPILPGEVILTHDRVPGRGPLEGFSVGLEASPAEVDTLFITSCDAPLLVPAFVNRLFDLCDAHDVAVPFDGQFLHPLTAVYRTTIRPHVDALLAANQLRVNGLFERINAHHVSLEELRETDPQLLSLINVNDPAGYQTALRFFEL